jgi:hypothetical protein
MDYIKVSKQYFKFSKSGDLIDGLISSQKIYLVDFILGEEDSFIRSNYQNIDTSYRYFKSCKFKKGNTFLTYFNIAIYV